MYLLPRVLEFSSGAVITLSEVTVADVRRLLDRGGEIGLEDVAEVCPDRFLCDGGGPGHQPTAGDLLAAWDEFRALNPGLFQTGKKSGPLRTRKAARDMDLACLALIEQGHVGIWEYPYRLFILLGERAAKR